MSAVAHQKHSVPGFQPGDDLILLIAVGAGERWAFEQIFHRWAGKLMALVQDSVPEDMADAVFADVMDGIWRNARTIDPEGFDAPAWLYTQLRHAITDHGFVMQTR